jgi:isochorismate hydrolase
MAGPHSACEQARKQEGHKRGDPVIEPYRMSHANELLANTTSRIIDPLRAVLFVRDMQYYFVRPFPGRCTAG